MRIIIQSSKEQLNNLTDTLILNKMSFILFHIIIDYIWLILYLNTRYLLHSIYILVHYTLWFRPDFYFDGTTFMGRSDIEINILEETEYVLVHYKLMDITVTELTYADGRNTCI